MLVHGPIDYNNTQDSSLPIMESLMDYLTNNQIDCYLYKIAYNNKHLGTPKVAVIPISDWTALVVIYDEIYNDSLLELVKIPLTGVDQLSHIFLNTNYWHKSYDLICPNSLDNIIRIININVDEFCKWPHKSKQ